MRKQNHHRPFFVILTWFLIYVFVLTAATAFICLYSYNTNLRIPQIAEFDALNYVSTGQFDPNIRSYGNAAFIYSNSKEIVSPGEAVENESAFRAYAEKYSPVVLDDGSVYKILVGHDTLFGITLVVGVPMPDGSGQYFFIKNLHSLSNLLVVLFCAMTIFLIMSCAYSIIIIRTNAKVEQMRREYVANISHEFKSPIASIRALSESMYDGVIRDEERTKKCLGIIIKESVNLKHAVMNMLELSKAQSMGKKVNKYIVAASDVFLPVIDQFSSRCIENEINFSVSSEFDKLPALYTNAERIRVLTSVLLDNAVKFVSNGGHISLSANTHHKKLVVCVHDDGIGIDKSEQNRIFERFYTVDHARNSNGSGLGLAIADETIKGLKEKIWVESSLGKGAAFYFTVSLAK